MALVFRGEIASILTIDEEKGRQMVTGACEMEHRKNIPRTGHGQTVVTVIVSRTQRW